MKKRWIAFLTVVVMGSVAAPGFSQAAVVQETIQLRAAGNSTSNTSTAETDTNSDGVTDNGFAYTVAAGAAQSDGTAGNGTATITGYTGTATALTVPLQITVDGNTYNVTEIGAAAFSGKAGLTSVTMQGGSTGTGSNNNSNNNSSSGTSASGTATGLQKIGEKAFFGCPALTSATIPATVTSIGSQAFSDCPALGTLTVTAGNQSYVSNDGVLYQYVGYSKDVTSNYNTYTLVQYPSGKTGTAYTAPATIANRLTAVAQGAFAGAQSLTSITLPESVETIGAEAFKNCSALTTMVVPDKVRVIPASAFSGCAALTSVSMPSEVTTIGESAFENCYALEAVTLPENLTAISASTFKNCTSLKEVTVPYSVTTIGNTAFAYCTALEKVTIPSTTTIGGSGAFLGDNSLTIYCHSGSPAATYASTNRIRTALTYTVRFLSDMGAQVSSQEVLQGAAATAPSMPVSPGYKLTWSSNFSNVTSDLTVTAIYTRVYTVTFVDEYQDKTATDTVEYGKAATAPSWSMSGYTLKWSSSFSSVTGDMKVYASWQDPKTGFVITKDTVKPASVGTKLTKGTGIYKVTGADPQSPKVTYTSCTNVSASAITIPASITVDGVTYKVTALASNVFKDNGSLRSVTIGANVVKIGAKAFAHCTKLSKVTIKSKTLATIGSKAFYNIKKNASVYAYRSKLTTYQKKIKSSGVKTTIKLKAIG